MHTTKTVLFTTFLYLFGNVFLLNAQADFTPLFKATTSQSRNDFQTDQRDTKRINYLELNNTGRNSLANLPAKMQFNLFPDVMMDVELEKSTKTYYKNMEVYRGRSQDRQFAHLQHYRDVIVIYNPTTGKITAQLETNKGAFQISPTREGNTYEVSEWENDEIDCQNFYERAIHQHNYKATSRSGCNERDADGKYVADLFIGYSYEASIRANDIDAHALSLTEMVNNGLTNSLVDNIYIRLVGTAISEHNPGVVTSVLGNVWTWFSDEIALTGADYVASIQVPTGGPSEAGGWAGVGGYSSVNSINSAAAVFRHELGHNVGSSHCTPGILPYAAGFNNGNVATHMCGNNINFYSTPLVNDANGTPIGDAATADNGRVWKERAPTVSARQQHTILFDENDTGCGNSVLVNGRYYIQNINSEMYLATDNGNTGGGTKITQATNQATNNQWDLIGVTPTSFRMIHTVSGRYIDVPGSSRSAGTDMILWSAHGNANQVFSIEEMGADTFTMKAFNGQCLQIQAGGLIEGDTIEQNTCDNSLNTKWRFIPVPGANVLSLEVATTDVSCYGNENGTATATATGGTGNYTFSWSNEVTGTSINNLAPGNYTVTVDDGTTNFPFAFSIKQVAPFEVTLTKTQATALEEANATATAVVSGGTAPYTYAWSNGNSETTATNLSAGLHEVTITDANSCALTKEFFIDCPDAFKLCDDGNPSTIGDHIDKNCNCIGKVFTCDNGLAVSNVAIGKIATQSSTSGAGDANRALDGNRDGIFNNGSVAATNAVEGVNAWWQVDLKDTVDITGILINNRTDCCTGRLEDYYVFVSSTPFESDDLNTTINQAGIVWSHNYQNATPLPDTLIEPNITGRYVRIQSTSDRALNLAEVGIFGCGVPTSQTITANPLGNNLYELKGYVINNGATITGVTVEHGATDFTESEGINITGINSVDTFFVTAIVDIGNATDYQFRIKFEDTTKSYFSNDFAFSVNEEYCTPTVDNTLWYKRFNRVVLEDKIYTDGGNVNYEDKTSFSFGEFEMGSTDTFQISTPSSWFNLTYLVYVDLNNDNDFDDYNELIGTGLPTSDPTDVIITIPTEDVVINRNLRMRILGHEGGAPTTCYSPIGNFKDFTIRIKAGACIGSGHLVPFFVDADNDGFGGEIVGATRNCSVTTVEGYVNNTEDCDDTNPNIHPNSEGICDDGIRTIINSISSGDDDVEERTSNGSINASSSDLELVMDGSNQTVGLRFRNLSVPNNAVITNAYIQFTTDEVGSEATDLVIHAENHDSSHAFMTTAFNVSRRNMTMDSVKWQPPSWTTVNAAGADQQTPNLSALVQAVVSRAGWTNGNPMSFIITGTGKRTVDSYNGGSTKAPKLYITYTQLCTFYKDNDGDGYGDPNNLQSSVNCAYLFSDYVTDNTDFDDNDKTSYPGAMEICDNIDNDGNGQIDEGAEYDTDNMTFTNEIIPTDVYTASQTISTNQIVTVATNTDVRMIAGQFIMLQPGFNAESGADFLAQINADCAAAFQEKEETNTSRIKEEQKILNLNKTNEIVQVIDNQETIKVFPNPFRAQTKINFSIHKATAVTLQIYSMNGQLITTIIDNQRYAIGEYNRDFSTTADMRGMYYLIDLFDIDSQQIT